MKTAHNFPWCCIYASQIYFYSRPKENCARPRWVDSSDALCCFNLQCLSSIFQVDLKFWRVHMTLRCPLATPPTSHAEQRETPSQRLSGYTISKWIEAKENNFEPDSVVIISCKFTIYSWMKLQTFCRYYFKTIFWKENMFHDDSCTKYIKVSAKGHYSQH